MKVLIDAVGIRGQGGAAVLVELLQWLPRVRPSWVWDAFVNHRDARDFALPELSRSVRCTDVAPGGWFRRFQWTSSEVPALSDRSECDVVLCLANLGSVRPRKPQVLLCHQPNALNPQRHRASLRYLVRLRLLRWGIHRTAQASKAVIVQTESMRNSIIRLCPGLQGRVHVIPSGYRTPPEKPSVRDEVSQMLQRCSRPLITFVSLPRTYKNHEVLLEAAAQLRSTFPELTVLFTAEQTGNRDPDTERMVSLLRERAAAVGVGDRLVWTGWLRPDEVTALLHASDLHVFPSLNESFGLPIVEAMAAGCPQVLADLPYAHDVGGNAVLYAEAHAAGAFAKAISSVLTDRHVRDALLRESASRSRQYNYRRIADQLAAILTASVAAG